MSSDAEVIEELKGVLNANLTLALEAPNNLPVEVVASILLGTTVALLSEANGTEREAAIDETINFLLQHKEQLH